MILVIALLGILFVAGAAFLQTVTLQARVVTADEEDRQQRAVVGMIEKLLFERLNDAWLGEGGVAYLPPKDTVDPDVDSNNYVAESRWAVAPVKDDEEPDRWDDAPLRLMQPSYGEAVGVHPLLSTIEPYERGNEYLVAEKCAEDPSGFDFFSAAMTDFNRLQAGRALRSGNTRIDTPRSCWDYWATIRYGDLGDPTSGSLPQDKVLYMDADGDGIPDSLSVRLASDPARTMSPKLSRSIPVAQRKALAQRLRASDASLATSDDLVFALRVVNNSGMVNLKYSHPLLINGVLSDAYDDAATVYEYGSDFRTEPEKYVPENDEPLLRYRNILPPRTLIDSSLLRELKTKYFDPADGESPFLVPFGPDGRSDGTFDSYRWWKFDPVVDAGSSSLYRTLFNADQTAGSPSYDRRHLCTTISYDDLLARGVRLPRNFNGSDAVDNMDVVEWMRQTGNNFVRPFYPAEIAAGDASDPRLGRLQLSIPWLEDWLSDRGVTLNEVGALPLTDTRRQMFVRFIQDTFWMMLLNHPDIDRSGSYDSNTDEPQRSLLAASLTANFIDFADNDSRNVPTEVEVIGPNGQPLTVGDVASVYGVEPQVYISELFTQLQNVSSPYDLAESESIFAIELHNPHDYAITLADYYLADLDTSDPGIRTFKDAESGNDLIRINSLDAPMPLAAWGSVPAGGHKMIWLYGTVPAGSGLPGFRPTDPDTSNMVFYAESEIVLLRDVSRPDEQVSGTQRFIPVDQIDLENDDIDASGIGSYDICRAPGIGSVQRDTSMYATDPDYAERPDPAVGRLPLWRVTVPWWRKFAGPLSDGHDAVGTLNALNKAKNVNIRPVQVECANTGSLHSAYPTTGSLLLLMRHAHQYDGVDPRLSKPANRAITAGGKLAAEIDQIDNGRMPIFDIGQRDASPQGRNPAYHAPPIDFQSDPWSDSQKWQDFTRLMRGRPQGVEALPWGALVFDYFTALPLNNSFDSLYPGSINGPKVDQSGVRVHGRININAAPWKVLASLPLAPTTYLDDLPDDKKPDLMLWKLGLAYSAETGRVPIGSELAKAIVAYRDGREIPTGGGGPGGASTGDYGDRVRHYDEGDPETNFIAGMRQGRGFLSVGELANVRYPLNTGDPFTDRLYRIDYGLVGREGSEPGSTQTWLDEDYFKAIGLLVGLEDWITTRSHVYTVYGVIQGATADPVASTEPGYAAFQASLDEAESKAIRFQETVNRLPCFFDPNALPERIGGLYIGSYRDSRGE